MPGIFVQLKLIHSSLKPFLSTKFLKTKFKVRTKRFISAPVPDSGTLVMGMDGRASLHGVAQKSWVSLLNSISVFCVRQKTIQSWPMSLWNSFYIRMSRMFFFVRKSPVI